jgi:hypothetical protein
MINVKKLIAMIERLEKGFSIEEMAIDIDDREFTFLVTFPKQKGLNPSGDSDFVGVKGKGDIDLYYERPYRASMEGPAGGGYEIDVSYPAGFIYVDEDGNESRVDPKESKVIEEILKKYFEDEFVERIEEKAEEYRTAYAGD